MSDQEIYFSWINKFTDRRYLRRARWLQLDALIKANKLHKILEFGSGISTLLFDSLGLDITSYETRPVYMAKIKSMCTSKVKFSVWDNNALDIKESFDLALVDGDLPRTQQMKLAVAHAKFVALDDFGTDVNKAEAMAILNGHKRIDDKSTPLAIFERPDNA